MQKVWCTKCGNGNVAGCRWCTACGDTLRPAYLDSQAGAGGGQKTCPVCGTVNRADAYNCSVCGTVLTKVAAQPEAQVASKSPPPAAGGSRLSRLAEARRKKEAEEGNSARSGGSDWLGSLRSDAPLPSDYATGMDEDDEIDPTLSAALRASQDDDEDTAMFAVGEPDTNAPPVEFELPLPMFTGEEPPITTPPRSMTDGGLPDWLQSLGGAALPAETPPFVASPAPSVKPPPAPSGSDGMPDWLSELSGSPVSPANPPVAPSPASPLIGSSGTETGEIPDWLREMQGGSPAPVNPAVAPAEEKDMPGWLRQTTDSLPAPSHPSFGDVDVEERLSFAFDEPIDRSSRSDDVNPLLGVDKPITLPFMFGGKRIGLTDLLGQESPLIDEVGTAPIPPADLKPWLHGLSLPTMEEPEVLGTMPGLSEGQGAPTVKGRFSVTDMLLAANRANVSADTIDPVLAEESNVSDVPNYPNNLVPWLQGLRPPRLDGMDAVEVEEDTTETRSFSLREMMQASNTAPSAEAAIPAPEAPVVPPAPPPPSVELDSTEMPTMPAWLNQESSGTAAQAIPSFTPQIPSGSFIPPLRFDDEEEQEDGEVIPFELPAFEGGPFAPSDNPPSLSRISGGAPADLEFTGFLAESNDGPGVLPSLALDDVGSPGFPGGAAMPAPKTEPADDVPDFLRDLGVTGSEMATAAPEPDLPDFLRDMDMGVAQPAPSAPEADLPDFLKEMGASGMATEAKPAPAPAKDDNSFAEGLGMAAAGMGVAGLGIAGLAGQDKQKTQSSSLEQPPPEGDSLDFLRSEADAMPTASDDDGPMPDWLAALSSGQAPAMPLPTPKETKGYTPMRMGISQAEEEQGELPEWLQPGGAAAGPAPAPAMPASEPVPDFLADMAATQVPPPAFNQNLPAQTAEQAGRGIRFSTDGLAPDTELPDWLSENRATPEAPEFTVPAQLPDWLDESETGGVHLGLEDLTSEGAEQVHPAQPAFESNLNDVAANSSASSFGGSNFLGDIEGPAWLRSTNQPKVLKPDTGQLAAEAQPASQVPTWLRTVAPQTAPEEVAVPSGPITFSSPDDDRLPQVNLPPQLASAAVLSALLAPAMGKIVTPQTEKEPITGLPGRLNTARLVRYGMYLLLALVVLFGLFTPLQTSPLTVTPPVQAFYDQIAALPPDSKVLITFDWEAGRSGEMRPMAQAVTQHVMQKRARLVNISLNPQGPALASRITDELATNPNYGNSSFYSYGTNYLNLGWRVGNEVAVRGLYDRMGELTEYKNGTVAGTTAVMKGINSLADFDLIIVLAGDEGSVRTWVEQFGIQPGARLLFGTPQAVGPLARPYALGLPNATQEIRTTEKQPRAKGLLVGLNDTAQYDQLLHDKLNLTTDQNLDLGKRLSLQSLAALMLVLVLVVANVIYLARRRE